MRTYKVFVGNNIYSIVPADSWTITSTGAANFIYEGEILMTFEKNEWFFVEVGQ